MRDGDVSTQQHHQLQVFSAQKFLCKDSRSASINIVLMIITLGGTFFQLFGLPFLYINLGLGRLVFTPIMLLQPITGLLHEGVHAASFPIVAPTSSAGVCSP